MIIGIKGCGEAHVGITDYRAERESRQLRSRVTIVGNGQKGDSRSGIADDKLGRVKGAKRDDEARQPGRYVLREAARHRQFDQRTRKILIARRNG